MVDERVERGVQLLNRKIPDWRLRVDVSKLSVNSTTQCVLGQVFGYYDHGLTALGINLDEARLYGFDGGADDMEVLDAAWGAELRREPAHHILSLLEDGNRWGKGAFFGYGQHCLLHAARCVGASPFPLAEVIRDHWPERLAERWDVAANTVIGFNDHRWTTWDDVRLVIEKTR